MPHSQSFCRLRSLPKPGRPVPSCGWKARRTTRPGRLALSATGQRDHSYSRPRSSLFQTRNFAGASRPAAYFPKSAFGSVPVWFTNFAQFTTRPDPANRVQPLPEVSRRGGRHARLFRADLLLTGVLFERQLDARFPFTTDHFTTRVAASTIWQTAIAWPCATHSRTVPSLEFSVRTPDAPLDIGAASVQKKGTGVTDSAR